MLRAEVWKKSITAASPQLGALDTSTTTWAPARPRRWRTCAQTPHHQRGGRGGVVWWGHTGVPPGGGGGTGNERKQKRGGGEMPATTQLAVTRLNINDAQCLALFASGLQPS